MKLIRDTPLPTIELTRRNLEVLLAKLDDPDSKRTLISVENYEEVAVVYAVENGEEVAAVRAVENDAHYTDRAPGPMLVNGAYL